MLPSWKKMLTFILDIYNFVESSLKPHKNLSIPAFLQWSEVHIKVLCWTVSPIIEIHNKAAPKTSASRSYEQWIQMCLVPPPPPPPSHLWQNLLIDPAALHPCTFFKQLCIFKLKISPRWGSASSLPILTVTFQHIIRTELLTLSWGRLAINWSWPKRPLSVGP